MRFLSMSALLMLSTPVFAAEPLKTTRDEVTELKAELALLKARVDAAESFAARLGYRPANTATPMPTATVAVQSGAVCTTVVQCKTGLFGRRQWVSVPSVGYRVFCTVPGTACPGGSCPAK